MDVTISHSLGREEARRRIREGSDSIANIVPGPIASVATSWPETDRMDLSIEAMGQRISGHIAIADDHVRCNIIVPAALGFLEPVISAAIRDKGQRVLSAPRD